MMKGQLAWVFGLVAIFTVILIFNIFVPVIGSDLRNSILNLTASDDSTLYDATVENQINLTMLVVPIALLILVVGVIIYMVASTQRDEYQSDIL